MKPEVEAALRRAAEFRRGLLGQLSTADRLRLLEDLFVDFFVVQWRVLLKWAALTGQSSQVDTGYIAQHVASILLAEPGQGFKGKGLDLLDESEVKSAAIVSGVDRPRWNHDLGTLANDAQRREKGRRTKSESFLSSPNVFYLLFDRLVPDEPGRTPLVLRVRGWCLDAQEDDAWREVLYRFLDSRKGRKYNLQLHPPVGYDDDLVVNQLGNLDFGDVKVFEAQIHGLGKHEEFHVEWPMRPPDEVRPVRGRSVGIPYEKSRPSRLSSAADVLPDIPTLEALLPGHDVAALVGLLEIETRVEEAEVDAADDEEPADEDLSDDD
jgi:hypothetical protein